jgi:hypothetical protein
VPFADSSNLFPRPQSAITVGDISKNDPLLQGIRDKLAILQRSKHDLESKIYENQFNNQTLSRTPALGGPTNSSQTHDYLFHYQSSQQQSQPVY